MSNAVGIHLPPLHETKLYIHFFKRKIDKYIVYLHYNNDAIWKPNNYTNKHLIRFNKYIILLLLLLKRETYNLEHLASSGDYRNLTNELASDLE